jgi:endonuclease YncB( thermonuclease family)
MRQTVIGGLLALLSLAVWAGNWSGRVVGIRDGDTLTILREGRGVSVRLDEIDAPELGQAYERQSRQSLAGLCFGRIADVREQGQDKYGRVLGRVSCSGTDVNAEQVKRGFAWFYAQYGKDFSLREFESSARARRVGLWAESDPVPPWAYRHERSNGGSGSEVRSGHGGTSVAGRTRGENCDGKKTCGDMASCEKAMYYLKRCGLVRLDRNRDGIPCESLCR